jgi:hypothetical protein
MSYNCCRPQCWTPTHTQSFVDESFRPGPPIYPDHPPPIPPPPKQYLIFAPGDYDVVIPDGTVNLEYFAVGAGGAGGALGDISEEDGIVIGGGGAGGELMEGSIPISLANKLSVTVGAGGVGVTNLGSGNNGHASSIKIDNILVVFAVGGSGGGVAGSSGPPGDGGSNIGSGPGGGGGCSLVEGGDPGLSMVGNNGDSGIIGGAGQGGNPKTPMTSFASAILKIPVDNEYQGGMGYVINIEPNIAVSEISVGGEGESINIGNATPSGYVPSKRSDGISGAVGLKFITSETQK